MIALVRRSSEAIAHGEPPVSFVHDEDLANEPHGVSGTCKPGVLGEVSASSIYGSAVLAVAGGFRRFNFSELSMEQRQHYVDNGTLPDSALHPLLARCGFGRKYLRIDTSKIREFGILSQYMEELKDKGRRGFMLMGNFGTGKTTTLCWVAQQLLVTFDGMSSDDIRFMPCDVLYGLIFRRDWDVIDRLKTVRYLMLDDLGRTHDSGFPSSMMESIIAYRYDNVLPTFFSTNLGEQALREHEYWGAVVDRMRDEEWMQKPLIIGGKSMRGERLR